MDAELISWLRNIGPAAGISVLLFWKYIRFLQDQRLEMRDVARSHEERVERIRADYEARMADLQADLQRTVDRVPDPKPLVRVCDYCGTKYRTGSPCQGCGAGGLWN